MHGINHCSRDDINHPEVIRITRYCRCINESSTPPGLWIGGLTSKQIIEVERTPWAGYQGAVTIYILGYSSETHLKFKSGEYSSLHYIHSSSQILSIRD